MKIKLFSVFCCFATLFISVMYPQTAKAKDDLVYFAQDNVIWEYNPATQTKKKKIVNGTRPILSPDRTKLAYEYNRQLNKKEDVRPGDNPMGIYILDLKTGENKIVYALDFGNDPIGIGGWSPNNKYLIISGGTDVMLGHVVINAISGKEIFNFQTYENSYCWTNESELVFSELQEVEQPRPYIQRQDGMGITVRDFEKNKSRVLKKATVTEDYQVLKLLVGNRILFKLSKVQSNADWVHDAHSSYWSMDRFGRNIKAEEVSAP